MQISIKCKEVSTITKSTCLVEDFLVRISVSLSNLRSWGGGKALMVNEVDFGSNMPELLGKLDLEQSSLKTAQCLLFEDLKKSYATFTSSGMMLNGDVFMLPTSASPILGKDFMVLPTPAASDGKILLKKVESYRTYYQRNHQDKSLYQFQLNGLTANQAMKMYEWMMGFPKNWMKELYTDTETQLYHQ